MRRGHKNTEHERFNLEIYTIDTKPPEKRCGGMQMLQT